MQSGIAMTCCCGLSLMQLRTVESMMQVGVQKMGSLAHCQQGKLQYEIL